MLRSAVLSRLKQYGEPETDHVSVVTRYAACLRHTVDHDEWLFSQTDP